MVPHVKIPHLGFIRPVQKGVIALCYFGLLFCNSENCAIF